MGDPFFDVDSDPSGGRVTVRGIVDASTVPAVCARVEEAVRQDRTELTVDLREVQILLASAVPLLDAAVAAAAERGLVVTLDAPPGCVADRVLAVLRDLPGDVAIAPPVGAETVGQP
ncbi:STAS domain-containing protein [Nocardioides zeae]|uniref:STAS domain-containing protein n=1 Tax=Nocardioides imazamoxiresistens TaxID=3231893 RepID=A0ABU3PQF5_9ACTN|nr:STAS domain-containing protein [Nocardioides zeae]MDT9591442.1 STAS domain-containing protein [Nocardioides zeae]